MSIHSMRTILTVLGMWFSVKQTWVSALKGFTVH